MNGCCCFSLETGALIIGVLEIIGGIIGLLISTAMVYFGAVVEQELKRKSFSYAEILFNVINGVSLVFLILSCIHILISALLIHGIRKKSNCLMNTWMTFKVIFIVILLKGFVAALFLPHSIGLLVSLGLLIGLTVFYVKVVYDLKNQNQQPSPNNSHDKMQSVELPLYMDLQQTKA